MKVIFLDIDGVLNSHKYLLKTDLEETNIYTNLDKLKLSMLQALIKQTGAVIVLTSSWRLSFDDNLNPTDYLSNSLLQALKIEELNLFSKTDNLQNNRYEEVKKWLNHHPAVTDYVILDDDDFNWQDIKQNWIKTSFYIGLTESICKEIFKKLS